MINLICFQCGKWKAKDSPKSICCILRLLFHSESNLSEITLESNLRLCLNMKFRIVNFSMELSKVQIT